MRAKSDIIAYLESQLSDDIWKKLRNSLLGRELLAFGAEVISENENVKDTMLLQMNPETADKNGLYMLSQMNEIPITNIKPSTLVVQMADSVKTYAPYELQYNVGNVHFTNIEYTMQGKSVSLINGTHKCYAVGMDRSADSVEGGSETFFYDGTTTYSGIKLGNAYPDSIVVTDDDGLEIPRYSSDIALSNNIDMMYKVVTGVDGNIYLRFIGSDINSNPTAYKVDWLDHSAMEFEVDDVNVIDPNIVGDDKTVATIEYYSQGIVDDLDYMRQQLKKEMAKYNGLNTPVSVENYVKGMPYILDAKCEKGEDGLCVYVKPSSPTQDNSMYLDFSEVAAHISLNSILFPSVKVKAANQIMFGVEISGINDLKLQQGIRSLLQERFSYENMNFNTIVNTGSILSEIYGKYGIVPTINMTIKERFVSGKPLSFVPIKNSLRLYGVDDSIVAWEENDLLYGKVESKSGITFMDFDVVGSMGTMYLLMYRGVYGNSDNDKETTDILTENVVLQNITYSLHERDITYDSTKGYNKFYLYDVNTNTIKPFDGCMQNLLYSDNKPCIKYNSWNTDEQSLGNVFDINFLSTNNALVAHFVFHNSGVEWYEDDDENAVFKDWVNNDNNKTLYHKYVQGSMCSIEPNNDYKGKYQTTFFVKNPLALKNYNSDGWNIFQNAVHGDSDTMEGLYEGLRNITDNGTLLNVKSNWFIHNNKSYYAYKIDGNYVYVTNGAKKLKITMNGGFLGMIPYENDLYVINEKYITKVIGFEGLKEKEEIYQIYTDSNTTVSIVQIIREFDNRIVFKTSRNTYYTATGFEIIGGNKMGFKDLKQIFDDTNVEVGVNAQIGGCTKDYVTLWERISEDNNGVEVNGFKFYSYEIGTSKTIVYIKSTTIASANESNTNTTHGTRKINLVQFWEDNVTDPSYLKEDGDDSSLTITGGTTGELVYYYDNAYNKIFEDNIDNNKIDNIYFITSFNKCYLMFDDDEHNVSIQLGIRRDSNVEGISVTDYRWYNTGSGSTTLDSDFITGFYKICYRLFKKNASTFKSNYEINNQETTQVTNGDFTTTTTTFVNVENQNFKYARTDTYSNNWYATGVNNNTMYYAGGDTRYYMTDDCRDEFGNLMGAVEPYIPKNKTFKKVDGTTLVLNDDYKFYKLNLVLFTKTTTVVTTNGYNVLENTGEEELSTIGFYNSETNSCVNDKGTETSYIKYHTQSPNNTSGSYLRLDESEIKFV